jgi:hypothetical protein
MAVRRELSGGLPLVEDARHSILRTRSRDLAKLEKHVYQRYPSREWGTFFNFGYRRTPWGLALSYVDGFWPKAGDMDRKVALTRFLDQYSRRAFHHAAESPLAVGVVHSHPEGCGTFPSPTDDDMDNYFAHEFAAYGNGKPYCSLVLQRNPDTGFSFTGRVYDRGEWLPLEKLINVGETIELFSSQATETRSNSRGNSQHGPCTAYFTARSSVGGSAEEIDRRNYWLQRDRFTSRPRAGARWRRLLRFG